jgi:hypothetical protein
MIVGMSNHGLLTCVVPAGEQHDFADVPDDHEQSVVKGEGWPGSQAM